MTKEITVKEKLDLVADTELTPEQAKSLEAASLRPPVKVKTRELPSRNSNQRGGCGLAANPATEGEKFFLEILKSPLDFVDNKCIIEA